MSKNFKGWTSENLEAAQKAALSKRLDKAAKAPTVPETVIQQNVIKEFKLRWPAIYNTGALFATPNEGKRTRANASRMKAEGMVSGVADLVFLWPVGDYCGACVEMKSKVGKLRPEQKDWLKHREISGYATAVCYSEKEAIEFFDKYLNNG